MKKRSLEQSAVLYRCIESLESRLFLAADHLKFITQPTTAVAGTTFDPIIYVAVRDGADKTVKSDTSSITLAITDESGPDGAVLVGTKTVAAVKGIATFSGLSISLAGSGYTFTATDGSLDEAESLSFDVVPAAAAKLSFSTAPASAEAGDLADVKVSVLDQYNNVVTSDSSSVKLAITTGPTGAELDGSVTVAAENGIATFADLKLETAGAYTITATDGKLTSVLSSSFTMDHGDAAHTVISPAANAVSNAPMSFTAKVVDIFGNVVTDDDRTISLSIDQNPPGAVYDGDMSTEAVNGIATFTGITLDKAGSYRIYASGSGAGSLNSTTFSISPGAATKLTFKVGPGNAVAGSAINPAFSVLVQDAAGNLVTTDKSKMTVAITTGPEGAAITGTATATAAGGVGTFTGLSLQKAGSYKFTVTDGTLSSAVSSTFTIAAGEAAKLLYSVAPTATTAGASLNPAVKVAIVDKFGNTTTSTANVSVSIVATPKGGALTGTSTVAAVAGVATFSGLKLNKVGSYTLGATSGKLTTTTSSAFAITAGAASNLVLNTIPASVVAGVKIPAVTATITDAYGNTITNSTASITVGITEDAGPDGAELGGTATVAAVAGVATFSTLALTKAGAGDNAYQLTASGTDLADGDSNTFSVVAAAASKLSIKTGPASIKAGVTSSGVLLQVLDQYNNVVLTDKSAVTLSVATGPTIAAKDPKTGLPKVGAAPVAAPISGTTTVNAVNGVATFSDLSYTAAGDYTITAKDGKLTSVTTSSFTISNNDAAQVIFVTNPTSAVAGATIPSFTAKVADAYGNVVTDSTDEVDLNIVGNPEIDGSGDTEKDAVAGVATFNDLKINTAGTYAITASSEGLASGTSTSFTISPDAALRVSWADYVNTSVVAGTNFGTVLKAKIIDQYGNTVTTDKSKITLGLEVSPTGSTITGTVTAQVANGVATFSSVALQTAGVYKLKLTDGELAGNGPIDVTVIPDVAAKLAFDVAPASAVAGAAISPAVKVKVQDKFGNTVTTDSSKVTLSTATVPTGATAGAIISKRAVNGVATFSNVAFKLAGSYGIIATDAKLAQAKANPITISPGAAAQLAITKSPTSTTAGTKGAATVAVQDQYGNLVATDTSSVTLAITPGTGASGATLDGTVTVAAVKGIATFADVSTKLAGRYRLTASDGSLGKAKTASFAVAPGAAAAVAIDDAPANVTSGATLGAVTVNLVDKFGNVITTDSKSKVVATVSGPTGAAIGGTLTQTFAEGVATFSDLAPKTAGANKLKFTSGALTVDESDAFTVAAGVATKVVLGTTPITATAGAALTSFTVKITDANGNTVTDADDEVTIAMVTSPSGSEIGGTETVAAVSGVATFSTINFETAGSYTLKATADDLTDSATSAAVVVKAAAAAKLVFKQAPADVVAGVNFAAPLSVYIKDQYDNVVTTDVSTVTLATASAPTGGTITGTLTAKAVAGVATFGALSLKIAGAYTLKMTDGTLTSVTSEEIDVTPAAAAKLAFVQAPTASETDAAIDPAVTVKVTDAFGNTVTSNTSNVTIAIATGASGAVLDGTKTVAADDGIATFDDLALDKAGSYTLKATDGSLTSITSTSFVITAAS